MASGIPPSSVVPSRALEAVEASAEPAQEDASRALKRRRLAVPPLQHVDSFAAPVAAPLPVPVAPRLSPRPVDPLQEYARQLAVEGAVVIPNVFSAAQLERYAAESAATFQRLLAKVAAESPAGTKTYTITTDVVHDLPKPFYRMDGMTILQIAPGRYDYVAGMVRNPLFGHVEFQRPPVLHALASRLLGAAYDVYSGAAPSEARAADGTWHRDIFPPHPEIERTGAVYDEAHFLPLAPFNFTALMPMIAMNRANGTTEFIPGSHRLPLAEAMERPSVQFDVEPGSAIFFDARILHRGRANSTDEPRVVLYHAYQKG